MGKHKAKWFERPEAYVKWEVLEAYERFLLAWDTAQMTGDYTQAINLRMRGRVGSIVRQVSDSLLVKQPKRWW